VTSSAGTPTRSVLLVHGAWHGSWCWEPLLPHLAAAGLDVATVDLPSAGDHGDLAADVAVVRAALDARPGPTVLLGHSYGGVVVSEAAAGRSDVAHLVYLCAFMLDAGESLFQAVGGEAPPWFVVDEADGTITVDPAVGIQVAYADVDPALAADWLGRLRPQSIAAFTAPQTAAAWHDVPSTYVACTQDQAIPYPAQQAMSARAGGVVTLESSHSPFASMPAEVAAVIAKVAG
jgi:pimeloyl-ACP methyl ester carboxylesterase